MTKKAFYTVTEIARMCEKSIPWVKKQIRLGNLEAKKVVLMQQGYIMGQHTRVKRVKLVVDGKAGQEFVSEHVLSV